MEWRSSSQRELMTTNYKVTLQTQNTYTLISCFYLNPSHLCDPFKLQLSICRQAVCSHAFISFELSVNLFEAFRLISSCTCMITYTSICVNWSYKGRHPSSDCLHQSHCLLKCFPSLPCQNILLSTSFSACISFSSCVLTKSCFCLICNAFGYFHCLILICKGLKGFDLPKRKSNNQKKPKRWEWRAKGH